MRLSTDHSFCEGRGGRRDLSVSDDDSAKECAFSIALKEREASGLAVCIQAAFHHFGGLCLGKTNQNQDQYKKNILKDYGVSVSKAQAGAEHSSKQSSDSRSGRYNEKHHSSGSLEMPL